MKWWRLSLLALLLLVALAIGLAMHPLRLPTRQPRTAATIPLRSEQHAVLLLVDEPALRSAAPRRHSETRCELEWINLLEQRFGACDVLAAQQLEASRGEILRGRMLIVVPRPLSTQLDSTLAPHFDAAVQAGTDVLFETPTGFWSRRLGLQARGTQSRAPLAWPSSAGAARRGESVIADPAPIPFRHDVVTYWPQVGELGLAQALVHPTGRPLGYGLSLGKGRWLVLAIDFAQFAHRLRQGAASEDLRLRTRYGDAEGPTTTDLVTLSELLQSDAAWLDRWLDALLDMEMASSPWPRLWPASFDADGFLLLQHEARGDDPRAHWISQAEAEVGLAATIFYAGTDSIARLQPAARAAERTEIALATHWPGAASWQDRAAPRRLYGVGKLAAFGRLLGLGEQLERLTRASGGVTPRAHLSLQRRWDADIDVPFEALSAAGIELDQSFGPSGEAAGWLFGSAVPFRPLSQSGRMHRLYELPSLTSADAARLDATRLRRWLRHNAEGGHGPIGLCFRSDGLAASPSPERFALWDELPELSAAALHRALRSSELLDFWRARADTRLSLRWDGRWLEVEIAPARPSDPALPTRALALAQQWQNRTLDAWHVDWPAPRSRRASSYGKSELLIELPQAGGVARFSYSEHP